MTSTYELIGCRIVEILPEAEFKLPPGTIRVIQGNRYVLKNGRWHRVEQAGELDRKREAQEAEQDTKERLELAADLEKERPYAVEKKGNQTQLTIAPKSLKLGAFDVLRGEVQISVGAGQVTIAPTTNTIIHKDGRREELPVPAQSYAPAYQPNLGSNPNQIDIHDYVFGAKGILKRSAGGYAEFAAEGGLDFQEAIDYLAAKTNLDTDSWTEGQGIAQLSAFTVASAKGALLQDIRDTIDRSLAEGEDIQGFLDRFSLLQDRWTGANAWRGTLIYEQNVRQAYGAGRLEQMNEVINRRPYWQWAHGNSPEPRPEHLELDGKIFRAEDVTAYPPTGFFCFPAGTLVATDSGWRAIESIRRGDLVYGGSGDLRDCIGTHINSFDGELIAVSVNHGQVLATPNHRFLTQRGWICAGNLSAEDVLIQVPNASTLDKRVRDISKTNPGDGAILMSSPVQDSPFAHAFDSPVCPVNLNVNPPVRDVEPVLNDCAESGQHINSKLFAFSRAGSAVRVPVWALSHGLEPVGIGNRSNFLSKERRGLFKLLGSGQSTSINILGFAKSRVIRALLVFGHLGHNLFRFFLSRRVSLVLQCNRLIPGFFETAVIDELHHRPRVHAPSTRQGSDGFETTAVESGEGFTYGAPLHSFDSVDDFLNAVDSHYVKNRIVALSRITYSGSVYNISVAEDESYVLQAGIVHNCRCKMFSLSEREFLRSGKKISEFTLKPDKGFADRKDIEKRIEDLKIDRELRSKMAEELLQNE